MYCYASMHPDSAERGHGSFAFETLLDLHLSSFGWTQFASFWLQQDYHCKYSAFLSSVAHPSELWKLRQYCVPCSQLIRRVGGLGAPELTAADGSEGSFMQDYALNVWRLAEFWAVGVKSHCIQQCEDPEVGSCLAHLRNSRGAQVAKVSGG